MQLVFFAYAKGNGRLNAGLAWAKPRRQNVDSGNKDRNWGRELTVRGTSRLLKNYLRCNYCVKNSLKMLIY